MGKGPENDKYIYKNSENKDKKAKGVGAGREAGEMVEF